MSEPGAQLERDVSQQTLEDARRAVGAFIKLCRATWAMTARVAACLPGDITYPQFTVLEALYTLGPMNQRTIAGKILRSTASVNVVVDNLERRGLVSRARSRVDRRNVEVSLTPKGRDLMREAIPIQVGAVTEELALLTPEQQEELGKMCRLLGTQEIRHTCRPALFPTSSGKC